MPSCLTAMPTVVQGVAIMVNTKAFSKLYDKVLVHSCQVD